MAKQVNATETAAIDYANDANYTRVYGNFSGTDIIVPQKTSNPKKEGSKAHTAYARFLDAYNNAASEGKPITYADSVKAGNAGYRVKWDADADRNIVHVYRKVG